MGQSWSRSKSCPWRTWKAMASMLLNSLIFFMIVCAVFSVFSLMFVVGKEWFFFCCCCSNGIFLGCLYLKCLVSRHSFFLKIFCSGYTICLKPSRTKYFYILHSYICFDGNNWCIKCLLDMLNVGDNHLKISFPVWK